MKQKKIVMSVYDADSNLVDVLSKDPARLDDVASALSFVDIGFEVCLSIREYNNE